ncbi:D-beta-hydroxybutyrate dehydrogenase, mitochondrial-like [Daphnia pulicaria]|uniref:D-beta-hydroxybutyrate dehydrogenase, mitochondrial-like n=1 Tax=Daphnia pulicaria TaxID=35523 RepID=UPI001EECCAB1|nr:D-beta-hydroxybutyrate dehydrogenase, mitochondrial-like [Daphnia pulicaria]
MKAEDLKEAQEYVTDIFAELRHLFKWQLLAAFTCFYLAYVLGDFSLAYFILCGAGFALLICTNYNSLQVTQEGRAVLITGCDSGYGYGLAKKLHAMGFTVFAGCLDEKSDGAIELKRFDEATGRLHVIRMDVTNQEHVDKALEYVKYNLPLQGLWGVVNNAAQSCCTGFLEWTSNEAYEKVMSVNLFGVIRVTNAFLPLIRKSQGRIVNVSSILNRTPSPFNGPFTITKGAIESYSAILRLEMKRFNVQVVVVEPGNFTDALNFNSDKFNFSRTVRRMWDQLDDQLRMDYGNNCVEKQIEIGQISMELSEKDTSAVVNAMAQSIAQLRPKDRYIIASPSEKVVAYAIQYLPNWMTDHLILALETNTSLSNLSGFEPFIII